MQGALGTVAEQNQTTGQGTRLVDVLCGEESDTPQGSEPVAKQARTDDYSMNVGQVTPPVVPGREAKGPEGSDVEFLRQLVREQQAQLNEAVRAANAATQAAAAATQALNAQQANLAMMQASTAHAADVAVQAASMSTVAVSAMDPSRAPAPVGQPKSLPKDVLEGLERVKVSFLRDLRAHQRALRREARAKSDVDFMGDPSSGMRYPAGMKGFTLPDNQIWLDECWKTVAEQSVNHTVEIPRGTSRRDAATLIHRAAAKQIRAIDHEGLQAHRETLDMKASKEAFISSCKIMLTSSREVQRDARLGLEVPQQETLDQTLVEVKVEELYRCAFETMRKELVQHDERLEKEREDAKRRDADLCSQRPGDLLQNLVQTSVTKALTDLGHVTDTQDEPEEVDGEKITQAIANTIRRNGQSPGGGQGHNTKGKGMKKKKLRKSKDTAKAKDNVQEPEQEQAPTKGSQKRQGKKSKTKDQGKDKGKGKGTNQASKPPWKESQPGGKGKGKGGKGKGSRVQ